MPESRSRKKPNMTPPPAAAAPKASPRWLAPTMISLMVTGLVWVVITYLSSAQYPVPGIGQYNLLIGFAFILVGFGMTTRWR
ncbi:cell division protein CrgA [Actinotalea sp.]|uniref:cell division protein CrgA n=1 Tax=Actinotalea sp. TaxID=1872145 RepID=UPI003563BBF1